MGRNKKIVENREVRKACAAKIAIKIITICPALILAASRKDSVIGRTEILVDSTKTRNGFNQEGAPPGRSIARNFIGIDRIDERIILSHIVRPNESVISRWLVILNTYGASLIRLNIIKKINNDEIIEFQPNRWRDRDRSSCWKMVVKRRKEVHDTWVGCIHTVGIIGIKMATLSIQNSCGGIGRDSIAIIGSNDEKMSVNIKTWASHY